MEVTVVIIDDNKDTLRHLGKYIEPVSTVTHDNSVITCKLHLLMPVLSRTGRTKVDLDATLKEALALNPGVAVIDLKLEGDAEDDYSGADLSFRIKEAFNDCCIVLVSHHFDAAPALLDNLEIFRFRVDRNQTNYGEELQKKFTESVKQHASAIEFHRLLRNRVASGQRTREPPSHSVYISYARDEPRDTGPRQEEIVRRIETSLRAKGYDVRRDRNNLKFAELISAFMRELGQARCIIIVLTKKYLHSKFCMSEMLEVYGNKEFVDRVCPIVLPDAHDVTDLSCQTCYQEYWDAQVQQLEHLYQKIPVVNLAQSQLRELHTYHGISQKIGELLSLFADMHHSTPEELEQDDFAALRKRIDQCLCLA